MNILANQMFKYIERCIPQFIQLYSSTVGLPSRMPALFLRRRSRESVGMPTGTASTPMKPSTFAGGESAIECPSPLNVLKYTYDYSCY